MDILLQNDVDRKERRISRFGILFEPLGYVDGVNRYEFVGDDPVGKIDPMGLAELPSTGPTTQPTTGPTTGPTPPPTTSPVTGAPVVVSNLTLPDGTVITVRVPPGTPVPRPPTTQPALPIGQQAQGQLNLLRLWGNSFAKADPDWSKDNQCDMQASNLMSYLRDVYKDEKPKLWDIQTVGGSSMLTNHNLVVLRPINGNPLPPMTLDSFHGPQHPLEDRDCKVGTLKDFQKEYPNPVRKGP